MKPKFTIYTPPYTDKSAGIWLLHFLCDRLNHLGYPATLIILPQGRFINPAFRTPFAPVSCYDPDTIVIYSEIISGNPLGADRVVRYLLFYDGALTGNLIQWGKTDFPLSYSKIFRGDCDILFYPVANLELFYVDDREKEGCCFYRGKLDYNEKIPALADCLEITRSWPESKHELAEIFRNRQLLFSLDSVSATIIDAALCGCVPVLFNPVHEIGELGKFWANDLSDTEIKTALMGMTALPEIIRDFQNSFDMRLEATVSKISNHFGLE